MIFVNDELDITLKLMNLEFGKLDFLLKLIGDKPYLLNWYNYY